MIDLYCERLDPGFWAEPLNALSNAGFLLAAGLAARQRQSGGSMLLVAVLALIGLGSFLFHTLATRWALWADVLPILVFQLLFLALYLRGVRAVSTRHTGLALAGFLAAGVLIEWLPLPPMNGSEGYLPPLLVLLGLAPGHWRRGGAERAGLWLAAGLFAVSLTLRSLDQALCPLWPWGTHWAWHLLNALVLYRCIRVIQAAAPRPPATTLSS
ncbi:MAG TPA: hypothetical protein VFV27_05945 [Nevskiaceae bacterium]|nr:hypothetical protein [Nevskiaceae bacterium]